MKLHGDKDVVVSASQDATAKVWTSSGDWTSQCPAVASAMIADPISEDDACGLSLLIIADPISESVDLFSVQLEEAMAEPTIISSHLVSNSQVQLPAHHPQASRRSDRPLHSSIGRVGLSFIAVAAVMQF